ncbi:hypothetical protein ACTFIY_005067 [Dictyostelium cf. discoideum]
MICNYKEILIKKVENENELNTAYSDVPLIISEDCKFREIRIDTAYKISSIDGIKKTFVRENEVGLSKGVEFDGVYYKVDNNISCLLNPSKENSVYQLYDSLFPQDKGFTNTIICYQWFKYELFKESMEKDSIFKESLNNNLEKMNIFIQGSLFIKGETLQKYILNNCNDLKSAYNKIDIKSYSAHIIPSLLSIPTDYHGDNFIVEKETFKIVGTDNDKAFECQEFRKTKDECFIGIKNILFTIGPLMNKPINQDIKSQFIQHQPNLFILKCLQSSQEKQSTYELFVSSIIDLGLPPFQIEKEKEITKDRLNLPFKFHRGWITSMLKRFKLISQLLLKNLNTDITHQELFEHVYPNGSSFYKLLSKLCNQDSIKQIQTIRDYEKCYGFPCDLKNEIIDIKKQIEATIEILPDTPELTLSKTVIELILNLEYIDFYYPFDFQPIINWLELDIKSICSILHSSIIANNSNILEQIELLISLGVDIDEKRDIDGLTALDLAAKKELLEVLIELIELGAGKVLDHSVISNYYNLNINKEKLKPIIPQLFLRNPKLIWEISLNEILPIDNNSNSINKRGYLKKLFDCNNQPNKPNQYGTRPVILIENENGLGIYFKFKPQFPGIEFAIKEFSEKLFGFCTPYSELVYINKFPVLLVQKVYGKTLFDVLNEESTSSSSNIENSIIERIENSNISKLITLSILTNNADGNLGNFTRYFIKSILYFFN